MIKIKKGIKLVLALVALPIVGFVGYLSIKTYYFYPPAPSADYPTPSNSAEANLQDLDYLRKFLEYDRSYSEAETQEALAYLETIEGSAASMSLAQLDLAVSRFVAIADNGHTNPWSGSRALRHHRLPIRTYFFGDELYILRATAEYENFLGAHITHIGGFPMSEVLASFEQYAGGRREGNLNFQLPVMIENADFLHELGFSDRNDAATLNLVLADGSEETLTIAAMPQGNEEARLWSHRTLAPHKHVTETPNWRSYFPAGDSIPLYLQSPDSFNLSEIPEIDAIYIQYWANNDLPDQSISDFNEEVVATLSRQPVDTIIVDLRFNTGGDYTKTADLMSAIPSYLSDSGRLYIITGKATFSAGIFSVGFLKASGGDKAFIIGEPIGDFERSWGETNDFVLPNSGIGITASTGLHDVENGCYDWRDCYWTDFEYDLVAGSLAPQIMAPLTIEHYRDGIDPVISKIIELETK